MPAIWRRRKAENAGRRRTSAAVSASKSDPKAAELEALLEDGDRVIRQIREANDAIPGEEISQKLFRLEEITSKNFLTMWKNTRRSCLKSESF